MVAIVGVAIGQGIIAPSSLGQDPAPADAQQGVEVLTRGPVHEAFAETISFDPQPGVVIHKAPPEPIEELPPEERPAGDNVEWIPGYWGWDDERDDFLWISGIWRSVPPDRQWVPGYWAQAGDNDYQWVSGYWGNARTNDVEYLPEPPATLEVGSNVDAPGPNQTWIPGTWVWHDARYAWRPGYWTEVQPNWVWVPAHYVYAPGGYVYVDGYFDYPVDNRGVLFAPVYFNEPVYANPGYYYSPATAISLGVFGNYLFLRPNYGHYYFGDYYAPNYVGAGFYPWFAYQNHRGYDPIFAHQRWSHRNDRDWERGLERDFEHRRDHEDARPPRTWNDARALAGKGAAGREGNALVAMPLGEMAKNKDGGHRFTSIDKQERQKLGERQQDFQKFRRERQQLETKSPEAGKDSPARLTLPKTPLAVRSGDQLGKDQALPERHKAPTPDPSVEAKPRVRGEGGQKPPSDRVAPITPLGKEPAGNRTKGLGSVPGNRRGSSPLESAAPATGLKSPDSPPQNLGAKGPDTQRPNARVTPNPRAVAQPNAKIAPQGVPKVAVDQPLPGENVGPQGGRKGVVNQNPPGRNFSPESRPGAGPRRGINNVPQPNKQLELSRPQTTNRVPSDSQGPRAGNLPAQGVAPLPGNVRAPQNNVPPPGQVPRFNRPQPQPQNQVTPPQQPQIAPGARPQSPTPQRQIAPQQPARVASPANQQQMQQRIERRGPQQPRKPEPKKDAPKDQPKPG
jgi:hypothetical protein